MGFERETLKDLAKELDVDAMAWTLEDLVADATTTHRMLGSEGRRVPGHWTQTEAAAGFAVLEGESQFQIWLEGELKRRAKAEAAAARR